MRLTFSVNVSTTKATPLAITFIANGGNIFTRFTRAPFDARVMLSFGMFSAIFNGVAEGQIHRWIATTALAATMMALEHHSGLPRRRLPCLAMLDVGPFAVSCHNTSSVLYEHYFC